jgi:hypothetical protein
MENNEQEQGLTIIEKSVEVFKGGHEILLSHQTRASKAIAIAEDIIIKWDEANAITDPNLKREALEKIDTRSNKFLANSKGTVEEMAESRKAITQLMDEVKKMYTAEENKINPEKSEQAQKIQQYRNNYAKWLIAEQERIKKEAALKAAKEKEAGDMQSRWKTGITNFLNEQLALKKTKMNNAFNAITLETFEKKKIQLIGMSPKFNMALVQQIVLLDIVNIYHSTEEYDKMKFDAKDMYDYDLFSSQWEADITSLKNSLVSRLNSKKEELEETERLRLEAEENEKKRQAELAKIKDKEARERAEKEAAEKKAEEEREVKRREQERIDRENAEKLKLQQEEDKRKKDVEEAAAREAAARTAKNLFDQVAATADAGTAPTARKSFIIKVLHPAGWVELFTFWFQKEGLTMTVEEIEKKTMKQIKSFVEKAAKGTKDAEPEMIVSQHVKYEEEVKAVNKVDK